MVTAQAIQIQLLSEETKMEDQRDLYQKNQFYQKKLGDTLLILVSDALCLVYITGKLKWVLKEGFNSRGNIFWA